jgi:hypothetical protein
MRLQPLSRVDDGALVNERVNSVIQAVNRFEEDQFIPTYAADTGSGTAYAIAPVPGVKQYVVGQMFTFKAANANTSTTPTLAVNGLAAGTIKRADGTDLAVGDIAANGFYEVMVGATTPVFYLQNGVAVGSSSVQSFLGANVNLNNTANFFDGPNTGSIGANGQKWLIIAQGTVYDSATASAQEIAIWNGSAYLANASVTTAAANFGSAIVTIALVTLTGATTFTLRARSQSTTTGVLATTLNATGVANKATSITAVRLT